LYYLKNYGFIFFLKDGMIFFFPPKAIALVFRV
jgi:hypothetical protein